MEWDGTGAGTEILRNVKLFHKVLEEQLELTYRVQIAGSHDYAIG